MIFLIYLLVSGIPLWAAAQDSYFPLVIIGGGVAGYSAAIYGGNARIQTAVFIGPRAGGQLAHAGLVENMPGVMPQQGYVIIQRLQDQAKNFGATIIDESIEKVTLMQGAGPRFALTTPEGATYYADALIVATGSSPRLLGIPGEAEFWGNGVSTCAICDCTLAQGKDVIVVGGGDSAVEEALQLAPYARTITLLLRSNDFRASPRMQEKLLAFDHISFRYDREVQEIFGGQSGMQGVKAYNKATDEYEILYAQAIFIAIGHIPETAFIRDLVRCDAHGSIILRNRQQSFVDGIFAAGDVTDSRYRQAIVASGDAAKAALDAIAFLRGIE